jgi:ubiquinol-cytochrome c reductase cytochrome b/c1 subunit
MSGHEDTYKPSGPFAKWMDDRLPIMRLMHGQFVDFPTPRNLNYLWTFGGILTFCLVAQILTGIVLAMHYVPSADAAFDSVQRIKRDVNYGWLIQSMHAVGASLFFVAVYIHIFRGLYYGSYKAPREVLWILGVFIFLAMMATAFLGYTLPWGQMSFWGVTVITNLFSSLDEVIPGLGTAVVTWLWGGYSVTGATLNRFFSLHYLLPFVIFGLVALHIWALHVAGQNNPTGLDVKSKADTVPMSPFAVMKDLFALTVFLIVFAWFVFFAPDYMGHADNYIPADPLVTPAHIVPEWYFLPFYAILRAITFDIGPISSKLGGVIAMFAAVGILAFVPWLDWSRVRSAKYRPMFKWFFWLFVIACLGLGYLGAKPAEGVYVVWAQIFTAYYFLFFLVIMPIVGLIETPSKMPGSISESVLADGHGETGGPAGASAAPAAPEKR